MEVSQSHHESSSPPSLLPSPTSRSSSSSSSTTTTTTTNTASANPTGPSNQNGQPPQGSPRPVTRSEPANPYPTTFVQADTSSFKQVVQMLTGSSKPDPTPPPPPPPQTTSRPHHHNIPPIKNIPKKSGSGFKLYERRNSLKSLKINPLAPFPGQPGSGASPRNAEILSPSILDFPSLALSPVTPLTHEPFTRSPRPAYGSSNLDTDAEEKAIRERGFFLHPSPATTPREPEPRLLPLFPLSSPRVSGSSSSN